MTSHAWTLESGQPFSLEAHPRLSLCFLQRCGNHVGGTRLGGTNWGGHLCRLQGALRHRGRWRSNRPIQFLGLPRCLKRLTLRPTLTLQLNGPSTRSFVPSTQPLERSLLLRHTSQSIVCIGKVDMQRRCGALLAWLWLCYRPAWRP